MSKEEGIIVAAFDFDGTLTRRDSLFPFLRFVSGFAGFTENLLRVLPDLCRYAIGRLDRQDVKEAVLRRFIAGKSRCDLSEFGRKFSEEKISRMLCKEGMDRLRWHQRQGHRCILVSASLDVYLEHWSYVHRFDGLACSRLDYDSDGRATGELRGANCRGVEKVRRLYDIVDAQTVTELYAYGDSSGDRELLSVADHAYFRKFSG